LDLTSRGVVRDQKPICLVTESIKGAELQNKLFKQFE
jgi:hypothetical protein